MEEIWRTIDWRPLYEVSNLGRVRNRKTKRIISTKRTKSHRHPQVYLYNNFWCMGGTYKEQFTVSHIVYNAFSKDKVHFVDGKVGQRIGHKDGDITNNRIDNLYRY